MRIGVIVPVRNGEKFIARCLQSLAVQTRLPDSLVVAENNSVDATRQEVEAVAAGLPFPCQCISLAAANAAAARNAGLKALAPDCEVVAFLDADCVAREDWLEEIEAFFLDHPQAEGLGGVTRGFCPQTPMQKFIALQRDHYSQKAACGWVHSPYDLFKGTLIDTNNAAFRRRALEALAGFDETLAVLEDADLSLRMLARNPICVFNSRMVVRHEDTATAPGYFRKLFWYRQEEQKAYRKHFGRVWVVKLPRFPLRIIAAKRTGGLVNGQTVLLLALLACLGIVPVWAGLAMVGYAGWWMIRFYPALRQAEFPCSAAWLPVFWFWFVVARLLGRVARWWGGIRCGYWVI